MKLKRSTVVFLTLFLVFSVAVTWMVFATLQRNVAGPTSSYSAIFSDVSGLAEGDDVRVAGVRVGRVDKIELTPDNQAKVSFQVRSNQTLYTNTLASVTYQNIIGQRYLGLSQGEGDKRKLAVGAQIPESRTNPSFDISYMLNGFEPLFTELDPQQVDNLTNAIITAFQGNQGSLLTLTTSVASAISAYELTSVAQRIESDSFRSFEVYGTVTVFYLAMSWMMMRFFALISARYFSYPVK